MENIKNYKLFLESNSVFRKYEIVKFTENYKLDIFAGSDVEVDVDIKKGDVLKLYFDKETTNGNYVVTAIRPLVTSQNEKKIEKKTLGLSELWEANFMLSKPVTFDKTNLPFEIEDYL